MASSIDKIMETFHDIIGYLIGHDSTNSACGINISEQFRPEDNPCLAIPRNINAAFLILLSGENHPRYLEVREYMEELRNDPIWAKSVNFYRDGIGLLLDEFQDFYLNNSNAEIVEKLRDRIKQHQESSCPSLEILEGIWSIFHPEVTGILSNKDLRTKSLREKRKIKITGLNSRPVSDVPREVLFTANALLTTPPSGVRFKDLDVSPRLYDALEEVGREDQIFWYDHPVQIGVEPDKNEIIHGLHHLSEALLYEKKARNVADDAEITCILSASVTHEGLQGIVKEYIEYELGKAHDLPGLKVYLFTEAETSRLIHEILTPAAERYLDDVKKPAVLLREVVGVDGRYGRHYSFLKAIAAFWQVFIDPGKRATFKIDLDQVFPQEQLIKETGKTAFQHLMSPLWGAHGIDSEGNPVHLGMLAGALINERDITSSLFTPDVTYPSSPFKGEDTIFCSKIPQALSTVSEMMTRYTDGFVDGNNSCISRIHVTGGTNGIMIDALRKYRPFTPVFIGRAEDQAYLLSVLFPTGKEPALRYLHKDGFFMRHDKESFAQTAVKAAAIGKIVGDYERTLFFSYYARVLPWGVEKIKEIIDPFTGSFVSPLPLNLAYLRLALKAATFFATNKEEDNYKGLELIKNGTKRLHAVIDEVSTKDRRGRHERAQDASPHAVTRKASEKDRRGLKGCYEREKAAWHIYYDIIDRFEDALKKGDPFAMELKDKANSLVDSIRVVTGNNP